MCDCSFSNDNLNVFKNLVGTHEGTSPRDLDQTISPRLKPKSQLFLLSLFAPALCLLRVLLVRLLLALLASFAWASNAGGRNFGGMSQTVFGAPDPSVASDFSGPGILRQLSEAGFGPDLDPSGKLTFRGRVLRRTCGGGPDFGWI